MLTDRLTDLSVPCNWRWCLDWLDFRHPESRMGNGVVENNDMDGLWWLKWAFGGLWRSVPFSHWFLLFTSQHDEEFLLSGESVARDLWSLCFSPWKNLTLLPQRAWLSLPSYVLYYIIRSPCKASLCMRSFSVSVEFFHSSHCLFDTKLLQHCMSAICKVNEALVFCSITLH